MENTVKRFKEILIKQQGYQHAMGIMMYDSETVMPRAAVQNLGRTIGMLSEESYKLSTSSELLEILNKIIENKDKVDEITYAEADKLLKDLQLISKIPMEEYVAYQTATSEATCAWHEAKEKGDYSIFEPHLAKLIDYTRKFAGYQKPEMTVYNAQLDTYEKGLTVEILDKFFADIRKVLVPLIHDIKTKGKKIDDSFLKLKYDIDKQRELTDYLVKLLALDPERSAVGEAEHPFTSGITYNDVRITTHYYEELMISNMYSVIHEGGHALYELGYDERLADSPLGGGTSMSIHESQSRFYENIIGRSEEFILLIYSELQKLFPKQLQGITAHQFYLAVNKAEPSLIRTEADELTYSLHIMVRYELEKKLLSGELSTKDLPQEWNRLYKEYLGVDVPNDVEGVLQDVHWSNGSFGYFPSYALGSAYGVQMLESMKKDINPFECIARGDINAITAWLKDKVFKYGASKTPAEIIKIATGTDFEPHYYTDYLVEKFSKLYEL